MLDVTQSDIPTTS